MYKPKEYSHIKDIPEGKYKGYVWSCQQKEPEMFYGDKIVDFKEWDIFPFVMEGFLYEEENDKERSISIRYTDEYSIREFNLKDLIDANAVLEEYEYIAHRLEAIEKVKFKQVWLPEDDPQCEGMSVLKLKAHLFTGFEPTKRS